MTLDIALGNDLPVLWYETVDRDDVRSAPPRRVAAAAFWHDAIASYIGFAVRLRARPAPRRRSPATRSGGSLAPSVGAMHDWRDPLPGMPLRRSTTSATRGRSCGRSSSTPSSGHATCATARARGRTAGVIGRLASGVADARQGARSGPFVARRQPTRVDLPPRRGACRSGRTARCGAAGSTSPSSPPSRARRCTSCAADRLDANAARGRGGAAGARPTSSPRTRRTRCPAVLRRLHGHGVGAEVDLAVRAVAGACASACRASASSTTARRSRPTSIRAAIRARRAAHQRQLGQRGGADRATRRRGAARPSTSGCASPCPGTWGGQFGIAGARRVAADVVRRRSTTRGSPCAALHVHRGLTIRDADDDGGATSAACSHALRRAARRDRLAPGDRSTSVAAWPARRRRPMPTRQYRLNRALGTDLLPPDPADCLTHRRRRRRWPRRWSREHAGAAGARRAASDARAGPGADRRHAVPADDGRRRQGRRRPLAHAILDAGINVAEPVAQRVPPAVQRHGAGRARRRPPTGSPGRSARRPTSSTTTGGCRRWSPGTSSRSWTPAPTSCRSRRRSRSPSRRSSMQDGDDRHDVAPGGETSSTRRPRRLDELERSDAVVDREVGDLGHDPARCRSPSACRRRRRRRRPARRGPPRG